MNEKEKQGLVFKLASIFSPGAPINKQELFAGRIPQATQVMNTIMQRGQHVIIYGERGIGKTSLANVISEFFADAGLHEHFIHVIINCDGTDTYSRLWNKIFREISFEINTPGLGFNAETSKKHISLNQFLPEEATPDDVRYLIERLTPKTSYIIIDELDRVQEKNTTTLLADTIKNLSDHSVETTLIFIGVADSVDELIAEHKSVERSLIQIPMPRMSTGELYEILDKNLAQVEMKITFEAKSFIASLSQGLPHYTHLLGLHASQNAVKDDRLEVEEDDVFSAINTAIENARQSITSIYYQATSSSRETLFSQVLLACALARTDELGYFASTDVRDPLSRIMGKPYDINAFSRHLNQFCSPKRGNVLQKAGTPRSYRFRFKNSLLQPFIIMHGIKNEMITVDQIDPNK